MIHQFTSLPKWAQEFIKAKESEIRSLKSELEMVAKGHDILYNYGSWFTIHGPPRDSIMENKNGDFYSLFTLSRDGAHRVCDLGIDDILLCGRRRKKEN